MSVFDYNRGYHKGQEDLRAELIKAVEKLEIEWNEFALEENSNLTKDAVELKCKLLSNPYEKVLALINELSEPKKREGIE